jgi:hypothetical protein
VLCSSNRVCSSNNTAVFTVITVCINRPGSLQATLQYAAVSESSDACHSRGLASHIGHNHNKKIVVSSSSSSSSGPTAGSATVGVKLELDARVRCSVQVK